MERNFIETLKEWKNENIHTPLMVVGARQVGKTYIIDEFCKNNFNDYVYINLANNNRIIEIFKQDDNMDNIVRDFKLELKREITEDTVIFIDEVQESEELISAMKYFQECEFPYKFILAGSLLGVKLKRFKKSFPVGKVIITYMYPMNFKEFLKAIGKSAYIGLIEECYENNKPMKEIFHKELLNDYRNYLCTGGMPEMVKHFVNNNQEMILQNINILRNIVDSYLADMKKFVSNMYEANKIEKIYKNIPLQLAKDNKRYQVSKIEKNARMRDYETAFEWLLASNLIIPCNYVNRFETPLKAFVEENNFKMYLNDVGLLVELLGTPYENILQDRDFMFKGALAENYVAAELIKNGHNLFYYQKPQVMEIDFLLDTKDGIIPVEVKAGVSVKSNSLNIFMQKAKLRTAIRISTKNFGYENNIKSVPLYATFCIKK